MVGGVSTFQIHGPVPSSAEWEMCDALDATNAQSTKRTRFSQMGFGPGWLRRNFGACCCVREILLRSEKLESLQLPRYSTSKMAWGTGQCATSRSKQTTKICTGTLQKVQKVNPKVSINLVLFVRENWTLCHFFATSFQQHKRLKSIQNSINNPVRCCFIESKAKIAKNKQKN